MKRKKIVLIISAIIVLVICAFIGFNTLNSFTYPDEITEGDTVFYKACKWVMEYDGEKIISIETIYDEAKNPGEGFYYEYDEYGNCTRYEYVDYAYQEGDDIWEIEYEDGRPIIRYPMAGSEEVFDYSIENQITVRGSDNSKASTVYKLDEDGNIIYVDWHSGSEWYEYEYDNGKMVAYSRGDSAWRNPQYRYQYDSEGRYMQIDYSFGNRESMTAEFQYTGNSRDCVAYTYDNNNGGEIVGKYYYFYKKGLLKEVVVYYTSSIFEENHEPITSWNSEYGHEHEYPSQEANLDYIRLMLR